MAATATTMAEMDQAAALFAEMLVMVGAEVVMALVAFGAPKLISAGRKAAGAVSDAVSAGVRKLDDAARARKARRATTKSEDAPAPKRMTQLEREKIIDERIKTDPKFAKNIKKDPDAVYGYSTRPESTYYKFEIDFYDIESVANAKSKRAAYLENLTKKKAALEEKISKELASGKSIEDIARSAVDKRNQGRIDSYVKDGNLDGLEVMYTANLEKYGQRDGPTLEYFISKGKTPRDIIESSTRTDHSFSAALGLWP